MNRQFVALVAGLALLGGSALPSHAQTTGETKVQTKTTTEDKAKAETDKELTELRERQVKSDKRAKAQRNEAGKTVKEKSSEATNAAKDATGVGDKKPN